MLGFIPNPKLVWVFDHFPPLCYTKSSLSEKRSPMNPDLIQQTQSYVRLKYEQEILYDRYAKSFGLSWTCLHLLLWLSRSPKPLTQKDLSEKLATSKQVVNSSIKHFKEEGLVDFEPNPKDGRQKFVLLTSKGKECVQKIVQPMELAERAAMADLSADEQAMLLNLSQRFQDRLQTELEKRMSHD